MIKLAFDSDPFLHRLERNTLVACTGLAGVAALFSGGDQRLVCGVLAGGGLVLASYGGIKAGVNVAFGASGRRPQQAWLLVKFFTRYAIVGLAAYLALVSARLHPVGLVVGASSFVLAVVAELFRGSGENRPSRYPEEQEH